MTNEDIGRLAQLVFELNSQFETQTDAAESQLTHAVLMHGNGDDMTVEFLGQIVYGSCHDGSVEEFEVTEKLIRGRMLSVLQSLKLLQL